MMRAFSFLVVKLIAKKQVKLNKPNDYCQAGRGLDLQRLLP